MGYLYYGTNAHAVEIDDRPLAHLKIAILSLLRAGKSIAFSYERGTDAGSGRETIWISPSTELRFRFNGNRAPKLNEAWVRAFITAAGSPTGLRLIPEPAMELSSRPAEARQLATAS